jgi:4-amino-4-deoxy-L-arabinose transferase-like glycosyltransferase
MTELRSFKLIDWILWLLVLAAAAGARWWYITEFTGKDATAPDAVWHVQEPPQTSGTPTDQLVAKMNESGVLPGFAGTPPLAAKEGPTAFWSPGYPMLRSLLEKNLQSRVADSPNPPAAVHGYVRWAQLGLGSLAAGLYFAVGRRAFHSRLIGLLAGLFYAANPFAVINVGELQDGTLTSFLLALALALGVRAGQQGGPLTSLLYGVALAALSLTRAALLPFAVAALLWFFLRSRTLKGGWLGAIVALLGFAGGIAPWIVRNHQDVKDIIPIVDSAGWHLWIGNNPQASGGPFDQKMEAQLSDRKKQLAELPEGKRYLQLLEDARSEAIDNPTATCKRRLAALAYFFVGASVAEGKGAMAGEGSQAPPAWLDQVLYGTLLLTVVLGLIGWRWSFGWRYQSGPLAIALFWIPIPYILGHAELLHGPRLPLDGPLMCLAAMALVCLIPGIGWNRLKGEDELKGEGE